MSLGILILTIIGIMKGMLYFASIWPGHNDMLGAAAIAVAVFVLHLQLKWMLRIRIKYDLNVQEYLSVTELMKKIRIGMSCNEAKACYSQMRIPFYLEMETVNTKVYIIETEERECIRLTFVHELLVKKERKKRNNE